MCKLWTISNVICLDYFTSSLPFHNLMPPFWPVIDTRTAALVLSLLSALSRCLSAISIVRPINSHTLIQRSSTNTELPKRCVLLSARSANFFCICVLCMVSILLGTVHLQIKHTLKQRHNIHHLWNHWQIRVLFISFGIVDLRKVWKKRNPDVRFLMSK